MYKEISSLQNPLIKEVVLLQEKSRERRKKELFIIEGQREVQLALAGNYKIETLLILSDLVSSDFLDQFDKHQIISVSKTVYDKIAYRNSTEGVLAIAKTKDLNLENIIFKTKNPLILIAESPEKPGNIGALLRTADAANLDAVFIANPKTDLYNPNIIRSSVGCLFTNQIATGTTAEIVDFLKKQNITSYAAALKDNATYYHEQDYSKASALIVGTEATGLSDEFIAEVDNIIIIPMQGKIDSMNVSVAAGILIFEAKRQRGFS
jgi:TrmH family RNA methyltransferase